MAIETKLKVKRVHLEQLQPNPWNPNVMSDAKKEKLRKTMERQGYLNPIVVRSAGKGKWEIVDGEQRWGELKKEGVEQVDVVVADLDDTEARIATVNLNELHGDWDEEKLIDLVKDLEPAVDEPLKDVLPWREVEISRMLADVFEPEVSEPEIPELTGKAKTKPGDMVKLGRHRLLCGDSTKAEDVRRLLGRKKANLVVTSPPYHNQREYSTWKSYEDYLEWTERVVKVLKDRLSSTFAVCWVIGSSEHTGDFIAADHYHIFKRHGYRWQECIVWIKETGTWRIMRSAHIDSGHYYPSPQWESILVFTGGEHPSFDVRDHKKVRQFQTNVWGMRKVVGSRQKVVGHPAMFPIEIPRRCILAYSKPDGAVLEPFGGSGQTLLAADQLGRTCYVMEKSPEYCDVIVHRYKDMVAERRGEK